MSNKNLNMEMNYRRQTDENSDPEKIGLMGEYNEDGSIYDLEENNQKRPLKQPTFLFEKKACCSNVIQILFCKGKPEKLKQNELSAYNKLKEIALISYDKYNLDHENSLKNLFINSLNCDLTENLETVDWKGIGFQVIN